MTQSKVQNGITRCGQATIHTFSYKGLPEAR